MGLDNGICVRRTEQTNTKSWLSRYCGHWDTKGEFDFDICYWRKCHNIREIVQEITGDRFVDGGDTILTFSDLVALQAELAELNEETWEEKGYSFWSWEDHEPVNNGHLASLAELLAALIDEGEDEYIVYFYDSY